MSIRQSLPLLAAAALLVGCEQYDWPPYEERLTDFFDANRASLEELEREMAEDGYGRMSPTIISGSLSYPAETSLTPAHVEKYERLIRPDDRELNVLRRDSGTEFELLSEAVDTSLYVFRYVHGAADAERPACDADMRLDACGSCAIDLARHWRLEVDWFPQDLDVEARECR